MSYQLERLLISLGIVVGIAGGLVVFNVISAFCYTRADFTKDRRYTLAAGSREIVRKLKSKVTVNFYYSRSTKEISSYVQDYARRVEDLLREYEMAGGGKLKIRRINVKPQSDAEDAANMAGMERLGLPGGLGYYYLGLGINCIDLSETLPMLDPRKENTLEYDISRAIMRVANPEKKVVGVMSTLPVMGPDKPNPFTARAQRAPWMFVRELQKDYEVQPVPLKSNQIPAEIEILLVLHPKRISAAALYAIDQFVLRGGRLVAFVDPWSIVDKPSQPVNQYMPSPMSQSTLSPLFVTWGIDFDTRKIVVDEAFAFQRRRGAPPEHGVLVLDDRAMGKEDVVSSGLDLILLPYAGAFAGEVATGLKKTVLISSSEHGRLIDAFKVRMRMDLSQDLKTTSGKKYALAIKLTGKFKSAFPEGPSPPAPAGDSDRSAPPPPPSGKPLTESARPGAVVLVGDVDLLRDDMWLTESRNPFTRKAFYTVRNDNNNFLQNAVEQLAGGYNLIGIRSRTIELPPFKVVKEKEVQANKKYRVKILEVQKEIGEINRKLSEKKQAKKGFSQMILSPEEKADIERLRKKLAGTEKTRRDLEKQLRRDIDFLGAALMWLNVGVVPLLVGLFGLGVWIYRRLR